MRYHGAARRDNASKVSSAANEPETSRGIVPDVSTYSAATGPLRSAATAAVVAVALTVVSCTSSKSATPSPSPLEPVTLRLMEFNIEYGGSQVDFDSVPAAIKAAGADVVAIEEAYATMPKIANAAPLTASICSTAS